MINLTDEQKEKIANRIQTPATNSEIKTSLIISKFQPEVPVLSETEVTQITSANSLSVSIGVCSPVLDGDKMITVSWIQNGTVHLAASRNEFLTDEFVWYEEDTGIEADSAVICYDGHVRKNRIGEPYLVTDVDPHIATIKDGVLEVHKNGVTTRIDDSVDCCDMCRAWGTNYQEYDKGLLVMYIKNSGIKYAVLTDSGWSQPMTPGFRHSAIGRLGISCKMSSGYMLNVATNDGASITNRIVKLGELSDANIDFIFYSFDDSWMSAASRTDIVSGVVNYSGTETESDIHKLSVSGDDADWKPENYYEAYHKYEYGAVFTYDAQPSIQTPTIFNGFMHIFLSYTQDAKMQIRDRCHSTYAIDIHGALFVAVSGTGGIYLYRYSHEQDVSNIIRSWDISFKSDNSVVELNAELDNVYYAWFESDYTVFNPGGKVQLYASFGDTNAILISTTFIDEVKFSEASDSVSITARDASGFFLKDSKIDYAEYSKSAKYTDHLDHILTARSVSSAVSNGFKPPVPIYSYKASKTKTFEHSGSSSEYELIDKLNALFDGKIDETNNTIEEYGIWSRSDGSIIIGPARVFKRFFPKAYVDIDEREVFEKSCTKNADSVYEAMNVYGKVTDDTTIKKACAQVQTYKGWYVSPRKECHITIDEKLTTAKRDYYRDTYVKRLNGTGKGYTYKFAFNPAITPKDVARRVNGTNKIVLGIITEVNHTFSTDDGYRTEIYIDSGGDVSVTAESAVANFAIDTAGVSVTPIDAEVSMLDMYGSSRNQSLLDLVQMNIGRAIK